jgi:glycosyltransferase involved in cell wall biosynthesis
LPLHSLPSSLSSATASEFKDIRTMVSDSSTSVAAEPAAEPPLRILLVADGRYPATGGAEKQLQLLARAFADAGHSVRVVAPWLDRTQPRTDLVDGIPLVRLAYPRIKLLGAALLCSHYGVWLWLRRRDFDAIHVNTAMNLAAVSGLLRPLLAATVTVKVSGAGEFSGGILDPEMRKHPLQRLHNWCIKRVDNLQSLSEYTRTMLTKAGYPDGQILMVPNAVDLCRFSPRGLATSAQNAPTRITYVGRIEPVKGVSVLVDAWSQVAGATNARLAIAGEGKQREELIGKAREAGLSESIDFMGEVSDVPAILAKTDIYVQPSLQEGLPNAVLEAMAAGLPIVATRVSGNEDVVVNEENGLLVPASDPDALAAALRRLVSDPSLAARMGRRSREMVEKRFGIGPVTRALTNAYRGRGHGPRATTTDAG